MPLTVYASNRIELLAARLAETLRTHPPKDAMVPAIVCVGSRGMERWLRHRLGMSALGITMNVAFPFTQQQLGTLFPSATTTDDPDAPWRPDALAWSILRCLPELLSDTDFTPLRHWLYRQRPGAYAPSANAPSAIVTRDHWALAHEIANVLDRASLFRPDWIAAWTRGEDPPGPPVWQRKLWSKLRASLPSSSLPLRVRESDPPRGDAVHVFAVASIPPLYLEAWSRVAAVREVFLYTVSPSREYWGDDATRKRLRKLDERGPADVEVLRAQQNPLLTALGAVARNALVAVQALDIVDPSETESNALFVAASAHCQRRLTGSCCALHTLQDDVFSYRSLADLKGLASQRVLAAEDDSLQFHDCHGATRQVEAAREAILDLMARHSHLQARDVLVMTPDIATYAPIVRAVFADGYSADNVRRPSPPPQAAEGRGGGLSGTPRLPTSIADLGIRQLNPVADVLLRALELVGGRLTLTKLIDFATLEAVRRRFDLDDEDLERLRELFPSAGARWGANAAERERHGTPAQYEYTMAQALDRLALGAVMPDEGTTQFAGVAPYDEMEGGATASFGKLAEFCARLEHWRAKLGGEAATEIPTMPEWVELLTEAARDLARPAEDAQPRTGDVSAALRELAREAQGFEGRVQIDALTALLAARFEGRQGGDRVISGAVTVCALQPMRSVPFKVICLLGMDDGKFPHSPGGRDFDRTLKLPRAGDQDPREEDRNLLLECVLSAREHLLVFYAGRDACTNETKAPAVPVGDLLDVCDVTFTVGGGEAACDILTRRHAVQPFSVSGFIPHPNAPARLDARMRDAALGLMASRGPWTGIHAEIPPLPPEPTPADSTIEDFVGWLRKPIRMFIRRRLGASMDLAEEAIHDREDLELDALQRWSLGDTIIRTLMEGRTDRDGVAADLLRRAKLPPGTPGRAQLEETWLQAEAVAEAVGRLGAIAKCAVEAKAGPVLLRGKVTLVGDTVLSIGVDDPSKPRRLLRLWVELLCLAVQSGKAVKGLSVGKGGAECPIALPENPQAVLDGLADLWLRARSRPIRLVEASSYAYAKTMHAKSDQHAAVGAAETEWQGGFGKDRADCDVPELAAVFPLSAPFEPGDPVHPEFHELATRLWLPLLDQCERGKA